MKKKKIYIESICIIIISLMSLVLISFNIISMYSGSLEEDNVLKVTNKFYQSANNPTDYQKQIFDDLTMALNNESSDENDLIIVDLVAKNFIADLFTWNNKDGNFEVGGQTYLYGSSLIAFNNYIKDTLYKDLDRYIVKYGKDYLPEVDEINSEAVYNGEFPTSLDTYPSYYVAASFDYSEHLDYDSELGSKVVDTSNFQKTMHLYIIKTDEGRFEVVQFFEEF